jgi:hypothetical protein
VHELLEALRAGDVDAEEAARTATADPPLIAVLLDGMRCDDPRVRPLAGEAAEAAARERPELVAPHADALLEIAATAEQEEVRRHAAQLLARTELGEERAREAADVLERYVSDASDAVRGWGLSALVAIANEHPALRRRARELVREALESGEGVLLERARLLADQADSWPSNSSAA